MFRKLVSNLPFNPSLLGEVAFYYSRLKQEEKLRRLGVIMVVLSFFVQTLAVASPPQPTLASSDNDIIRGGFQNRDQAVLMCLDGNRDFSRILSYYRVDCTILSKAESVWIRSTDYNKELDSMGRHSRGSVITRTGKPTNEYRVSIAGTTYYMRNLWAFDSGAYSSYKVLRMKNKDGKTIMIMYDCGNIVTVGKYTPPPPPPPPPTPPPPPPPTPQDACPNIPDVQYSLSDCDVCPNIPDIQSTQEECYPCPDAEDVSAVETCLQLDKTASNLTQNIDDANGTTARAGDTIAYTLSVKNDGKVAVPDFLLEENLSDVLHYSDVVDNDGGTLKNKTISWPETTIAAGETLKKTITVKVKDPIPETPISTSDPTAYDLVMNNTFYGKSVNIKLPPPVNKRVEIVTKTLPSTGPGESMLAAAGVTMFVGYFLARAHLLRKETQLIRLEYAAGGTE